MAGRNWMCTRTALCLWTHMVQLGSGVFSKALVDEDGVGLEHCAVLKHSGDLGNKSFIPAVPCLGRWWWTCPRFWWLLPGAEPRWAAWWCSQPPLPIPCVQHVGPKPCLWKLEVMTGLVKCGKNRQAWGCERRIGSKCNYSVVFPDE